MRKINPKQIDTLLGLINHGPYFELLFMKVCELDIGYSKVEVDLRSKHMNPFGAIYGGAYSSIIDTAAYWSTYCGLDEDVGYTSIDGNVNNLSMINKGRIIVEGRAIKIGKSLCLTGAAAKDRVGRMLAHGTSKLMALKVNQSTSHAIEAMRYNALPPKFLD